MGILGSITKFAANYIFAIAEYNSSPATITDGQQAPLQCDPNGNLRVSLATSGASSGTVKVTDGTNIETVKAASTPSVATDTAAVVDLRPGGVLPVSANPADAVSNSTSVSRIGAWLGGFNGTTWDRVRAGLSGVQTTLTGMLNMIPMAQYNTAAPTPANGNVVPFQSDASGNLKGVEQGGGAFTVAAALSSDAVANPTTTKTGSMNFGFNGAQWERLRTGLSGTLTSLVGFLDVIPVGTFNLVKPTLADGNFTPVQFDSNGNLRTAEQFVGGYENNGAGVAYTLGRAIPTNDGAWSTTSSGGTAVGTSGVSVKASPGRVRRLSITNKNATTGFYLMLHNKASAPVNSDAPVDRFWVPERDVTAKDTVNTVVIDFGPEGRYFSTGIGIAASSTVDTVTLLAGLDCHYCIDWI
jgi:hypothetical protein